MIKSFFPSEKRGKANYGWLEARYSFSFAGYYSPVNIRFGALRVLNDDIIQGGGGFGTHPHDNMEIITIPLKGALSHRDSMGHESIINAGDVQVMTAGTGITHSEFNASSSDEINLLQLWVFPRKNGLEPRYDQKSFGSESDGSFQLIVSPDGRDSSLWINQDAFFTIACLEEGIVEEYKMFDNENGIYFFLIEGEVEIENELLKSRDALGLKEINEVKITAKSKCRLLIIEVPV